MKSILGGLAQYTSKITDDLKVTGTEQKDVFTDTYLKDEALRQKFKLVGTHSDAFHCDEVFATTMLLYTQQFKDSIIVRTRDQELLNQLDIQCDVGAVYDPAANRFDHHQKTFTNYFYEEKERKAYEEGLKDGSIEAGTAFEPGKRAFKMSSAGLVYKHFGQEVIAAICKDVFSKELSEKEMELLYNKIYDGLVLEVDAIDNGINIAKETNYNPSTDLASRIGCYNLPWNHPAGSPQTQHTQFKEAMRLAEEELVSRIYRIVNITMPARSIVQEAWDGMKDFHPSGQFIWFEKTCPWKEHLMKIEKENKLEGHVKFAFFKDGRGMFRIQAIPKASSGFDNRVSICKDYRGLRGDDLNKASGATDAEFVHAAGFIGGCWSLESCVKMAEASLKEHEAAEQAAAKANPEV